MAEFRGYSTDSYEGTRGSMTRIAGDFRDEWTMRNRRSLVTTAGHWGQYAFTLVSHSTIRWRKRRGDEYCTAPSCSQRPAEPAIGMRLGTPFSVQLFQASQR